MLSPPKMGALVTRAMRPIKSFNIENRAHRVISREKPIPAPMYPSNLLDLNRTKEEHPDLDDKLDKKDPGLDDRLKNVYVTSRGRPEDDVTRELRAKQSKNRPLPQDRKVVEFFEMGFKDPDRVKYGNTTLRDAINYIQAHQINPEEVTVAKIALGYKMREDDVASILKYFKTYEVYLPKTKTSPAVFAGPSHLRKKIEEDKIRMLEEAKEDQIEVEKKKIPFKALNVIHRGKDPT